MPFLQTSATRRDENDSLPSQVQAKVPQCANSCLTSYVAQGYSCDSADFSCLCSAYSNQGYTLGELAYVCLDTSCPGYTDTEAHSLYDICNDQTKAVEPTKSPLTVPSSSPVVPTSIVSATGTPSTSTIPPNSYPSDLSSTTNLQSSVTQTSMSSSRNTPTATASQTTAIVAAVTAAGTDKATSLSSGQAVGISLAAFGGIGLIIGGIFFLAWWRRRRIWKADYKEKRHSYDFVDDAPPRFSPFNYGYNDPRGPLGGFHCPRVELDNERRRTQWPTNINKPLPVLEREDVSSIRTGARSVTPGSPNSIDSQRTVSQLLPDRPSRTPPMPAFQSASRPPSVYTQATVFEEEEAKSPQASGGSIPPMPMPPKSVLKAWSNTAVSANPRKTQQDSASSPLPMSLTLQIPRQAPRQERIPSPTTFTVAPVAQPPNAPNPESSGSGIGIAVGSRPASAKSRAFSNHSDFPPKSGASLIPDYYTSMESGTPGLSQPRSTSFASNDADVEAPKLFASPAQLARRSTSSNTTFESNDIDEATPPENEEARLSPVVESGGSPISGIKYPKVPRSSNQAVPRSPPPQPSPRSMLFLKSDVKPHVPSNPVQLCKPATIARKPVQQPRLIMQPQAPTAVPRTPPRQPSDDSTTSEMDLSGTTLAAKRRGHTAAKSLENGLHLDAVHARRGGPTPQSNATTSTNDSIAIKNHRPIHTNRSESPLKGYGRAANTETARQRQHARPQVAEIKANMMMGGPNMAVVDSPSFYPVYPPPPSLATVADGQQQQQQQQQQRRRHQYASYATPQTPQWSPELTPGRRTDDFFFSLRLGSEDSSPARPLKR
ncbi:hypothetical protein K431DRAFT_280582 [Polychaeton citri CBS 116435]|uniref:CFEM domain-containing protein n=1 Tax=Polychaeton citri CBS 116435 TaxID=1314669 RepID=A0A9P4QGI7_9PEZI|nr:hypothetical protein K431DRAFT_280582 [Polychaeton citri CBS 116435]